MYHSYSKPLAYGHKFVERIFLGEFVIQEKIDGSQFSFGIDAETEELVIHSRTQKVGFNDQGMFKLGIEYVLNLYEAGKLVPGWIYRGEYLQKPKHNTLAYARVPQNHIILFDIDAGNCDYLSPEELEHEANELGLESVPTFFYGVLVDTSLEEIRGFLNEDSILGGVKIEGIVIKNYDQLFPDGKVMMAKIVSDSFKEKHNKDWKQRNPSGKDLVTEIIADYGSEARWSKAVQHLQEAGVLVNAPQDIPLLMKELADDFDSECSEEIKELLWNKYRKDIWKGISRGFPEWYKQYLEESLD